METICLQCSDKGFAHALVFCVCLDFAVHRYCLDKLLETFDEFVYWFCEDCKPKSAKKFPLGKPSSKPFKKRDHMILNDTQGTHSGINLKKKEVIYSVAETEEQRLRKSPSQQPRETHKKLDLTVCARSVDDCSPLRAKLKKKGGSCSMAKAQEQRHQSSSSQQPCEAHTKLYLTERAELKRDCSPLNMKLERKKDDVALSVVEIEEQKCQCSCSQHPYEAHTKVNAPDCALWVSDCSPLIETRSIPQCSKNSENHLQFGKQRSLILEEGNKSGKEAKCARIDASRTGPADLSNILEHNYHLHARPIIDPIWSC